VSKSSDVQHEGAATGSTPKGRRPTHSADAPVRTTLSDHAARSSHRGAQGFKCPPLRSVRQAGCDLAATLLIFMQWPWDRRRARLHSSQTYDPVQR